MTLEKLEQYLLKVYSIDTCYSKCKNNWNINNPVIGQCAVASLIVNDYFGGDIYKVNVEGVSHYFNIINDKIIDLTKNQFNKQINYSNKEKKDRNKILSSGDTLYRYNLLKSKLLDIIR